MRESRHDCELGSNKCGSMSFCTCSLARSKARFDLSDGQCVVPQACRLVSRAAPVPLLNLLI